MGVRFLIFSMGWEIKCTNRISGRRGESLPVIVSCGSLVLIRVVDWSCRVISGREILRRR